MPKLKLDTTHVVIADSDPLARRVVRDALQDRTGFVIPAEASTGSEAIELSLHYRPDVTLMETSLPGVDGLTATRRIHELAPEVRVLILSRDDQEDVQLQALQAGAAGFVSKNVPVETVSRVVKSVVRGEAAVSRKLTMRLVERLRHLPEGGVGMRPVQSPLTEREWEVLDLLCQGKNTREIAETLVLCEETVYSHSKNVLRKLNVHTREEAVAAATQLRQPIVGLADSAGAAGDTPPALKLAESSSR
ncbi:MAG TPA: response regulator transcription factor [Solirubrobacterales bacterium]|jgi:DNA-binding NarL/FixJ family response regulator